MQPLSPFVAQQVGVILHMAPNRLAKRLKCSAHNAALAQQLIVLTLVKEYRRTKGRDIADLQAQGHALASRMAKQQEGELAQIFRALLLPG